MKKVLSFVLALVMVMALSVTAFADVHQGEGTIPAEGESESTNIEATFNKHDDVVNHKYHVTVNWQPTVVISYSNGYTTYTWDPANTKYETKATDEAWSVNEGANIKITVENRSDGAIKAVCGAPEDLTGGKATITGGYDTTTNGTLNIGSAAGANYTAGEMQSASATYSITGVTGYIDKTGAIASITVTVNAVS